MTSREFCRAAILCLITCLGTNAYSQSSTTPKEMQGVRHLGPGQIGDTNATFALGLTTDNGLSFVTTALLSQPHKVVGFVRPEAAHVNQPADIFVVERVNNAFVMRDTAGNALPWNGVVAQLVPFRDNEILTSNHPVDYFNGTMSAGEHRLFIGYQPADGVLRYTNIALIVNITEKSARDLAMEAFTANISSAVVPLCITCHVSGGQADGLALHKFVPTSDPSHLTINFTQFENLVKAPGKGRLYVLSKVRGENSHVGGTLLTPSQPAYQNLDSFLQMLETL